MSFLVIKVVHVISIHILTRRMTQKDGRVSKVGTISIHILTRRMTHPRRHPSLLGSISIHILTRRMTERSLWSTGDLAISIHILTRRMTVMQHIRLFGISDFNPHPHTEDDSKRHSQRKRARHFNPHPHTEDDCCIWYILLQNIAYIEIDTTLSS